MRIANCEGDELLMSICTSISDRKYYIKYVRTGAERLLGMTYYPKGRFDRYKVISTQTRLGNIQGNDYEIVLKESCTNFNLAVARLNRLMTKIQYSVSQHIGEEVGMQLWLGPEDKSNFRFKVATRQPYKGSRGAKPEIYEQLRQYVISAYDAQVIYEYEGDDALGINKDIMVHRDKDINMIAGDHYDFAKNKFWSTDNIGWLTMVGKDIKGAGKKLFFAQLLMGDRTDDIPSIPHPRYKGWGSKTVHDLLVNCSSEKELLALIVKAYQEALPNTWLQVLMEQADLVWICQEYGKYGHDYLEGLML